MGLWGWETLWESRGKLMGSYPAIWSFEKRGARVLALRGLVAVLAWALTVVPFAGSFASSAHAAEKDTKTKAVSLNGTQNSNKIESPKVTPAQQTQQQAQQNAQDKNDKGAGLAKVLSVLTMALGGLMVYKGVQNLTSCSSSAGTAPSDPTGSAAGTAQAGSVQSTTAEAESAIGAKADGAAIASGMSSGLLAATAVTGNSCTDGMINTIAGGMMLVQGLMGMQGAKEAKGNANAAGTNASMLGSLNTSGISGSTVKDDEIKIDPSLLRKGKANSVMSDFENKFGINRDDFASAVGSGVDPRQLLMNAPKNAISAAALNNAVSEASKLSPDQQAELMAKAGVGDLQKEMMEEYEIPVGAGGGRSLAGSGSDTELAPLPDLLGQNPEQQANAGFGDLQLSPEVQAALEKQALLDQTNGNTNITIFQMVKNKYKEKYGMIYGNVNASGGMTGIAGADGYGQ